MECQKNKKEKRKSDVTSDSEDTDNEGYPYVIHTCRNGDVHNPGDTELTESVSEEQAHDTVTQEHVESPAEGTIQEDDIIGTESGTDSDNLNDHHKENMQVDEVGSAEHIQEQLTKFHRNWFMHTVMT